MPKRSRKDDEENPVATGAVTGAAKRVVTAEEKARQRARARAWYNSTQQKPNASKSSAKKNAGNAPKTVESADESSSPRRAKKRRRLSEPVSSTATPARPPRRSAPKTNPQPSKSKTKATETNKAKPKPAATEKHNVAPGVAAQSSSSSQQHQGLRSGLQAKTIAKNKPSVSIEDQKMARALEKARARDQEKKKKKENGSTGMVPSASGPTAAVGAQPAEAVKAPPIASVKTPPLANKVKLTVGTSDRGVSSIKPASIVKPPPPPTAQRDTRSSAAQKEESIARMREESRSREAQKKGSTARMREETATADLAANNAVSAIRKVAAQTTTQARKESRPNGVAKKPPSGALVSDSVQDSQKLPPEVPAAGAPPRHIHDDESEDEPSMSSFEEEDDDDLYYDEDGDFYGEEDEEQQEEGSRLARGGTLRENDVDARPKGGSFWSTCKSVVKYGLLLYFAFWCGGGSVEEKYREIAGWLGASVDDQVPPCFLDSSGPAVATTNDNGNISEVVLVHYCEGIPESEWAACPSEAHCSGGVISRCLASDFCEISPNKDSCIFSSEANKTSLAVVERLRDWSIQDSCSWEKDRSPAHRVGERPLFRFDLLSATAVAEKDDGKLLRLLQLKDERESTFVLEKLQADDGSEFFAVGLHPHQPLKFPTTCVLKNLALALAKLVESVCLKILQIVAKAAWECFTSFPISSTVAVLVCWIIFAFLSRRRRHQQERSDLAQDRKLVREDVWEILSRDPSVKHDCLSIRDTIMWKRYPGSRASRARLQNTIWKLVVDDIQRDSRIQSTQDIRNNRRCVLWQWSDQ